MRKKSIIEQYTQIPVSGTFNMQEKSNFLTGKMMYIPDTIRISYNFNSADIISSSLIKLNTLNNTSNNYIKEKALTSITLDPKQSTLDSNTLSNWIFELDANYLLREYLYNKIYTLNTHSPFNNININDIPNHNINAMVYDYINLNILNRYQLSQVILWTQYFPLNYNTVPGSGVGSGNALLINPIINLLKQSPTFSYIAIPTNNPNGTIDSLSETISITPYSDGFYDIAYKQTKSSQYYTFIYYYDVIFTRI